MPLGSQSQRSFATGMWPGEAPDMIPGDGAADIRDYLLNVQGRPYRRGGVLEYASAFGDDVLMFVGDFHLSAGQRTVIAKRDDFGVLGDDKVPVSLGGGGILNPVRAHVIQGHLVWDGGTTYGGSRKAADYRTGTIAVTNGSATVAGTGVDWTSNADAGMILRLDGGGREYIVKSVDSANQLTLAEPYAGDTGSGAFYALTRTGLAPRIARSYAVVGKRLFSFLGNRAYFSPYDSPAVSNDADYHQIPGGAEILGGESIGDSAVAFTTDGVWEITNVSLEPLDDFGNVQQRLEHLNASVLWSREGLCKWNENVIVPALDGIFVMGSGFQRLDLPIERLYQSYIRSGLKCGVSWIDRSHFFLPILEQTNDVVDLLVCRLDPPVYQGRHMPWINPWTHFRGAGVGVAGAVRTQTGERPVTLVAGKRPELMEARYFDADASVPDDLGTPIDEQIVTRAYPTGQGNQNVTRWVQLDTELWDTQEGDNPTLEVAFSTGEREAPAADWGQFDWGEGDWTEPDASDWQDIGNVTESLRGTVQQKLAVMGVNGAPRSRTIQFRLRSSGRVAKLLLRGLTIWTRQSTKAD